MLWAIIGLPSSGRSTLFKLLTNKGSSGKSGKGMDLAVVKVLDPRLQELCEVFHPDKITPAEIEFADTVGQIGKGGAAFSELQRADCLAYCIRAFDGGYGKPRPIEDLTTLKNEFALFDLGIIERKVENIEKELRTCPNAEKRQIEKRLEWMKGKKDHLEAGGSIRDMGLDDEQMELISNFALLTAKPAVVVLSCDEEHFCMREKLVAEAEKIIAEAKILPLMVQMEIELEELCEEEACIFREEYGLCETAVDAFVHTAYEAMEVKTFFTGGDNEVRAWTVSRKAKAVDCAGKIHTDMARGFIRAEVIGYHELLEIGNWNKAKSLGKIRQEGKDYHVVDGDVIIMKFAV